MSSSGLQRGDLGRGTVHLCVDMQRMFAEQTDWHTPWMARVLPAVRRVAEAHAADTIFTRFIPAQRAGEGAGTWKRYYERWASMTVERLGEPMLQIVPELRALIPPAQVIDKRAYSPWTDSTLQELLRQRRADTVVITGAETDVCVLATALGAVDRGYGVIMVTDALCSSSDETHDALLRLFDSRYGQQIETSTSAEILAVWA